MSGNWFAKKLGTPQPPAQQAPSAPVQQAPMTQMPQQYTQAPQAPQQAPEGNIHAMDAVAAFQGKQAQVLETGLCPNCDSPNYMSRAYTYNAAGKAVKTNWKMNDNGVSMPPSSQCFDCNYTEDTRYDLVGLDVKGIVK